MAWYRWQQDSLLLYCHLQPGASKSEFAGLHGERLKIRIKAPPVDGKANKALIRFIAEAFAVPAAGVEISSGAGSRQKTLIISQPAHLPEQLDISPP